jgi:hypothetical protein
MTDQQTSSTSSSSQIGLLVRKILLPLGAFIVAVSLPTDWLFTTVLTKYAELTNTHKLAKLSERDLQPQEIPIFGPSIARNAYYGDSLGENYYNYAMENASTSIILLLLELETEKPKNTPIILDYHFRFLEYDSAGTSINIRTYLPFVRSNERIREFLKENDRFRPHQVIPGARYFGVHSSYVKDYLAEIYQPTKVYHQGGVFNKKAPPQVQFDRLKETRLAMGPRPFLRNAEIEAKLEALIAANPDRLFLFIGSPRHHTVLDMLMNYEDMKAWGRDMQARYDNVRFILFEADYPDSYFKDTGHLSLFGAQRFSGQMRRALQQEGLYFTGDEGKSVWPPKPDDIRVIRLAP